MQPHWDIFCRVIDNYGDIGVCWRLARQLSAEHGLAVRLWLDAPEALTALCPSYDAALDRQTISGVEIGHWRDPFPAVETAEVVIEAFACELPANYLQAMARRKEAPRWINLEYLSAESWVEECHGLASPHPALPLVKHFFFPGFSEKTGGLPRESELLARRDAFWAQQVRWGDRMDDGRLEALFPHPHPGPPLEGEGEQHGRSKVPSSPFKGEAGRGMRSTSALMRSPWQTRTDTLEISLFCYDAAPVGALLDACAAGETPVRCRVPPGKPLQAVLRHLDGKPMRQGQLEIVPIPFLPQSEFDRLLWQCDINFVRGEDSFVRAQWAGKPFVWHIYPQPDDAHRTKLEAFLNLYTAGLPPSATEAMRNLFHAWNACGPDIAQVWRAFLDHRPTLEKHALEWATHLAKHEDLAARLVKFCKAKL